MQPGIKNDIFYWSILEGLWNFEIWRIKFSFRQNVVLQYWHSILENWACFSLKCLLAVRLCWNVLVHSRHLNNPFFIWTHPIPSDNWSKVASISPTNRWSQLIFFYQNSSQNYWRIANRKFQCIIRVHENISALI